MTDRYDDMRVSPDPSQADALRRRLHERLASASRDDRKDRPHLHPDARLDPQPDLGPKWMPAFVRIDTELPKLSSLKIDKKVLRRDAWTVPGVVWRPSRAAPLHLLTDDERERLAHLLGAPTDGGRPASGRP